MAGIRAEFAGRDKAATPARDLAGVHEGQTQSVATSAS